MITPPFQTTWPYPRWIAHRGAGLQAPENTLAAFREGAERGYRMFECDVQISADGIPFLLHDIELDRTTQAHGMACEWRWDKLEKLDAGAWHSMAFAGEPLPTLEAVCQFCIHRGLMLNIEIKPAPGLERKTGEIVAREAARLWRGQGIPPLITSFQPAALQASRVIAPDLPRGLLTHEHIPDDLGLQIVDELECVIWAQNHPLWHQDLVKRAHVAGIRTMAYTVNDPIAAQKLIGMGIDHLITDEVRRFPP